MQQQRNSLPEHGYKHTLEPIAHVLPEDLQVTHPLEEHLSTVSQLAGKMASEFGAEEWGKIAGLWHDLGKYSDDFQSYIRGKSGYEAHLVDATAGRVNHSSAGALHAEAAFGKLGLVLAYLIAGHHAGLPDWFSDQTGGAALENRMKDGKETCLLQQALKAAPKAILQQQIPSLSAVKKGEEFNSISDFSGLGFKYPALGLVMSVFLFSLAGIPPTGGFMGKFYIFTETLRSGYVWLVIAAGVNSVVSIYYYLRVVVVMYFQPQPAENPMMLTAIAPEAVVALAATTAAVLLMGIFPSYFWSVASNSIFSLM